MGLLVLRLGKNTIFNFIIDYFIESKWESSHIRFFFPQNSQISILKDTTEN